MTPTAKPALPARTVTPLLLLCLALFAVLHAGLMVHDHAHPTRFLDGDRATKRQNKINILLGIEQTLKDAPPPWSTLRTTLDPQTARAMPSTQKLLNLGPPGDYVFHAGLYAVGGKFAVIGFQCLLGLVAVFCVFRLCRLMGLGEGWAFAATTVAMALPATIVQQHQLTTEGLFAPLTAIGVYLLVRSVEEPFRARVLSLGLVMIAIAMLIRTQLLLYPLVLAVIFVWCYPGEWKRFVVPTLLICFAVPVGWAVFDALQPASAHVANTELSLSRNLSGIVKRMSLAGRFAFDRGVYPGERMPIGDFIGYVIQHPLAFLYVKLTDVIEVVFNPAITILGKYLGIDLFRFETADGKRFWSQLRARAGIYGIVAELFRQSPVFLASFLAAVALWCSILALALFGTWRLLFDPKPTQAAKAILLSFVLYNLAIVQVSEMVRATHRSTVEFVIVLLAAIGLRDACAWAMAKRRGRATARAIDAAGSVQH